MVLVKTYDEIPFSEKEILRYAGSAWSDKETVKLMRECIEEARGVIKYKACYCDLPIEVKDGVCDFESFRVASKSLSKNLEKCKRVILFAATLGAEFDRLIVKYSRLSPSKALLFQAIGTESIEALCDKFCNDVANNSKPRFSPGYGDLPLEIQKEIFAILECEKKIGISLNKSLSMSPSKSVTAFMGLD